MNNKFYYILLLMVLVLVSASSRFFCDAKQGSQSGDTVRISWQAAFQEKGFTIIPGLVKASFGTFQFRWFISSEGTIKLVTLESSGGGELPPLEKKLFLWTHEDRTTYLFQEWVPQLNAKEPRTIRLIAKVSTNELFSVLPRVNRPPISTINQPIQPIEWGKGYSKKGIQYLPGSLKASFGTLNIYWKKEANGIPELIAIESPGGGELPPRESRLYFWMDEKTATTVIFQERQPQLNQESPPYLWPLAAVRTAELMSGFKQINRQIEDKHFKDKQRPAKNFLIEE